MNRKRGGFKPLTDGLPQSVSVPQVIANMKKSDEIANGRRRTVSVASLQPGASPAVLLPSAMTRSLRETQARHDSYAVGDTAPSTIDLRHDIPGPMLLKVTEIDSYDNNPRVFGNDAREDIRQGLKAHGFTGTFVVTQRHAGGNWMLSAGSNTTLELMKELYAETQDQRFLYVNCVPQAYKGEATVLAQHLGENINRGDMRFWEVAKGMVELLSLIEVERRRDDPKVKELSAREAADEIAANRGLRVTKTRIALYRFTVRVLEALGTAREALTMRAVRDTYQPRINALGALAERFGLDEPRFLAEIVKPVLAHAGTQYRPDEAMEGSDALNAEAVCAAMEATFADKVAETASEVTRMLAILRLNPKATLQEMRQPSPNLIAGGAFAEGGARSRAAAPAPAVEPARVQAPLNLNPGLVRDRHQANVAEPEAGAAAANPSRDPLPHTQGQAPTAHGPLFASQDAQPDAFPALHGALQTVLASAGLEDTLRWHDPMPLGFFLDLPDPLIHARKPVAMGSPEDHARTVKTLVWWHLTTLACQWMDGISECIDPSSAFYRVYSVERAQQINPLEGTDIAPEGPDSTGIVFARVAPGMQEINRQLHEVEARVAQVFDQMPERWKLVQRLIQSSKY